MKLLALALIFLVSSPALAKPAPRFHTGGASVARFHSTRAPREPRPTRGPHVKIIYQHYRATRPLETWYSRGTRYTVYGRY